MAGAQRGEDTCGLQKVRHARGGHGDVRRFNRDSRRVDQWRDARLLCHWGRFDLRAVPLPRRCARARGRHVRRRLKDPRGRLVGACADDVPPLLHAALLLLPLVLDCVLLVLCDALHLRVLADQLRRGNGDGLPVPHERRALPSRLHEQHHRAHLLQRPHRHLRRPTRRNHRGYGGVRARLVGGASPRHDRAARRRVRLRPRRVRVLIGRGIVGGVDQPHPGGDCVAAALCHEVRVRHDQQPESELGTLREGFEQRDADRVGSDPAALHSSRTLRRRVIRAAVRERLPR
mmetsp:Transcript_53148/g.126458  ORF Transcript_53148/g.126458 Transcript_53148/m.126458 type:complete len:289 (+) Transcript_53148:779-1645(+)